MRRLASVIVVFVGLLVVGWGLFGRPGRPEPTSERSPALAPPPSKSPPKARRKSSERPPPTDTVRDPSEFSKADNDEDSDAPSDEIPVLAEELTEEPYPVDLDALRAELPDNLYWALGAPTDDSEILRERKQHQARVTRVWGLIQSNTASLEDIDWFYDHKEQLSRDYLQFTERVLEKYGSELPERDLGLYELSKSMHEHRLRDYPGDREDAKRRKALQDEKRRAWKTEPGQ